MSKEEIDNWLDEEDAELERKNRAKNAPHYRKKKKNWSTFKWSNIICFKSVSRRLSRALLVKLKKNQANFVNF